VFDISETWNSADQELFEQFQSKKQVLVLNKSDLPHKLELPNGSGAPSTEVSCLTGRGIEALKDTIKNLIWTGEVGSEMLQVMINSRHRDALRRARSATQAVIDGLQANLTLELVALDLRTAVNAIGEIVGKTSTEDLLDSIFSQFCIG